MATGKDIKEDIVQTAEDIKSWASAKGAQIAESSRGWAESVAKKAEEIKQDLSKQQDELEDKAYDRRKEWIHEHPDLWDDEISVWETCFLKNSIVMWII